MGTGIYRANMAGGQEEIPQNQIDFWCGLCQFPLGVDKCFKQLHIQQCWAGVSAVAGEWHKQHECPFIHLQQVCQCNDYKNIEEAFKAVGLEYHKAKKE